MNRVRTAEQVVALENGPNATQGVILPFPVVEAVAKNDNGTPGRFRTFLADSEWMELAAKRGIRLPMHSEAATPAKIERWLHRLGLNGAWFADWFGYPRLSDWQKRNPMWGLRALVGLILEDLP